MSSPRHTDIDVYLETAEEKNIPVLERRRFTVRDELRTVQEQPATQQTAKEVAVIEDAADQLAVYTNATEQLQETTVDRATLEELREQKQSLSQVNSRIDEIESTLQRKQLEFETQRAAQTDARERHSELRQRESDVERVESDLATYREQTADLSAGDDETGLESRLAQRRYVTIACLVGARLDGGGGALAGSLGAILLGVVLLLIAIGAWVSHRRLTSRAAEADAREEALLQTARDAGVDVQEPADVAP